MYYDELEIKPKKNDTATVSLQIGENSVIVVSMKRKDLELAIQKYRALLEDEQE